MHLSRYIAYWGHHRRDEPVLSCDDALMTWGELEQKTAVLAAAYAALGLKRGDRLACLLNNSLDWCVVFVAAARLGAIFVPLNPAFGYVELGEIVNDAGCALIVSNDTLIAKLRPNYKPAEPSGDEEIFIYKGAQDRTPTKLSDALRGQRPKGLPTIDDDNDVLAISYTSGTTGVPKGVMLSHRGVEAATLSTALVFGLTSVERFLLLAPLAFTGGVISILVPTLILGARVYVEKKYNAPRALALIEKYKITIMGGVPALWQRISDLPEFKTTDISSMRNGMTGGAPVSMALLNAYVAKGVLLRQSYGCTELGGGCTLPTRETALQRPASCGRALISCELEVRNEQGEVCKPGEVGEICGKGPQAMLGYWNNEAATEAAFDGDWYRTGDLATTDEFGDIIVVDRKKNMIISGGVNVYAAEVERTLLSLPQVLEVVALGIPSKVWGEEVVAVVYAEEIVDLPKLHTEAKSRLGNFKAPKQIRLSKSPLPKTASGKIARSSLIALFESLAT